MNFLDLRRQSATFCPITGEKILYRLMIAAIGLSMLAGSVPAFAGHGGAGASGECEAARIKARAGGPTNEHDAWLLETCGCEPGSTNAFCQRLEHRREPVSHRQHKRHRREYSTLCVSLWSGTSGRAKNKQRGPHILSDASACAGTGTRSSSDGFPLAECHRAFPKKEVPPVIRLDTSQEEDDWVALVHTTPGTGQEEPPLP